MVNAAACVFAPSQKLADIWAYPDYINAAAAAQDPLERMKLLVAWMVAGVHQQKPELCFIGAVVSHTNMSLSK
jgi:hypothetical protein